MGTKKKLYSAANKSHSKSCQDFGHYRTMNDTAEELTDTGQRVKFDVSGQVFTIYKDKLTSGPASKLKGLYQNAPTNSDHPIYVDRSANCFGAILGWYQTGELHIPMAICPGFFLKELDYWNIKHTTLTSCCFYRLKCFLDEQETLRKFQKAVSGDIDDSAQMCQRALPGSAFRSRVWSVVDYCENTWSARAYFILTVLMILLSIFIPAYMTDPVFKRSMSNCERLEVMQYHAMEDYNLVEPYLRDCDNYVLPFDNISAYVITTDTTEGDQIDHGSHGNQREVTHVSTNKIEDNALDASKRDASANGMEFSPSKVSIRMNRREIKPSTTNKGTIKTSKSERMITASSTNKKLFDDIELLYVMIRINTSLGASNGSNASDVIWKVVKIPDGHLPIRPLVTLETVTAAFFLLDIILRMVSCPNLGRYFRSVINISDAMSLTGILVHTIMLQFYSHKRHYDFWVVVLEYLQILRAFRLFRIVKNVKASRVLVYSVFQNIKDLSVLGLFLAVGTCVFASIIYVCEDNSTVSSIPVGWYWALVTMTTVGYGDVTPKTTCGRFFACLCATSGVLLFALTVPIFTNHFITLYQYAAVGNTEHEDEDDVSTADGFEETAATAADDKIGDDVRYERINVPNNSYTDIERFV